MVKELVLCGTREALSRTLNPYLSFLSPNPRYFVCSVPDVAYLDPSLWLHHYPAFCRWLKLLWGSDFLL